MMTWAWAEGGPPEEEPGDRRGLLTLPHLLHKGQQLTYPQGHKNQGVQSRGPGLRRQAHPR